jgi:asparagine synthase (glutamine-hydrolysing)
LTVRCVGIADERIDLVTTFTRRAEAEGLCVVGAPTVAVAYDRDARPAVGATTHEDGSFVVLDGELFSADPNAPVDPPDAMAARLLGLLRSAGVDGLRGESFEGIVTWWDAPRGHVVVFGDQLGAVPLNVGTVGTASLWANDVADLVAAGVAPEPDPDAFAMLALLGWVPPPICALRDGAGVHAGQIVTIRPGRDPEVTPWFLHTAEPPTAGDLDGQADAVGGALLDSVARRTADAHHLGAFLSAGIDSLAIVTVVRRLLDLPIDTFTFRYLGYEGEHNEDEFAAGTAQLLGASHTTIEVRPEELRDRFASMVHTYGAPISFGVHSFKQETIRDAGIDVMLTGADPGGWYGRDRSGWLTSVLWRIPPRARLATIPLTERLRKLPKGDALYWAAVLANRSIKNQYVSRETSRDLLGAAADRAALRLAASLGDIAGEYRAEAIEHRPAFVKAAALRYVAEWNTRWGRAYGYPIRAPFYDPQVAVRIEQRRPWDHEKAPLRRFAARHVPHDRAYAPKIYQEMPLAQWLRGPLRDLLRDSLARERVEQSGILAFEPVQRLVAEHLSGHDRKWPLWQLMSAVEWSLQLQAPRSTLLDGAVRP